VAAKPLDEAIASALRKQISKGISKKNLDELNNYIFEAARSNKNVLKLPLNSEVGDTESGNLRI
jgi:hypothetical protein